MYKYIFDTHKLENLNRKAYVPLVYFDFIWPTKVSYFTFFQLNTLTKNFFNIFKQTKYDGYLNVQLNPIRAPQNTEAQGFAHSIFEIEEVKPDYG